MIRSKREEMFIVCVQTAAIVKDIQDHRRIAQDAVELAYRQIGNLPDHKYVSDILVEDIINYTYTPKDKADWIKEE